MSNEPRNKSDEEQVGMKNSKNKSKTRPDSPKGSKSKSDVKQDSKGKMTSPKKSNLAMSSSKSRPDSVFDSKSKLDSSTSTFKSLKSPTFSKDKENPYKNPYPKPSKSTKPHDDFSTLSNTSGVPSKYKSAQDSDKGKSSVASAVLGGVKSRDKTKSNVIASKPYGSHTPDLSSTAKSVVSGSKLFPSSNVDTGKFSKFKFIYFLFH